MKKNEKHIVAKKIAKVAHMMGSSSTDSCWYWFHQPKVPQSMSNVKKEKK